MVKLEFNFRYFMNTYLREEEKISYMHNDLKY